MYKGKQQHRKKGTTRTSKDKKKKKRDPLEVDQQKKIKQFFRERKGPMWASETKQLANALDKNLLAGVAFPNGLGARSHKLQTTSYN